MKLLRVWKNQIFIKLVVTFLLVILPIYFIGINVYHWAIDTLRNQLDESMISQVDFYLSGLETEIQKIKLLQYQQINDLDLNKLAFGPEALSDYDKSHAILAVQQQLLAITESSRYIDYVNAQIPILDMTISSSDMKEALSFNATEETSKAVPRSLLTKSNDKLVLTLHYPFSAEMQKSTGRSFSVMIVLTSKEFENALNQFCTADGSFATMTNPTLGLTFYGGDKPKDMQNANDIMLSNSGKKKSYAYSEVIDGKPYLAIYSTSDYLGMVLARYMPEAIVYKPMEKYQVWFWILSGASLIIIFIYSLSTYRFIQRPLSTMVRAFKKVENGDLEIHIEHHQNDEFRYLYQRFNDMAANLGMLIDQVYKQKILVQQAELKQLQSQINPHFLYNSFFMLYGMARAENAGNTAYYLNRLGSYYEFITRNSADDVPLAMEVEHARIYTEIQVMRFSNRITADFEELPQEFAFVIVPRLILQPIIENAFKYALEEMAGDGVIRVRFERSGKKLRIVVEDNGKGLDAEKSSAIKRMLDQENGGELTATINIHRRLKLKFGDTSGLEITAGDLGGLRIALCIALAEGNDVQTADC